MNQTIKSCPLIGLSSYFPSVYVHAPSRTSIYWIYLNLLNLLNLFEFIWIYWIYWIYWVYLNLLNLFEFIESNHQILPINRPISLLPFSVCACTFQNVSFHGFVRAAKHDSCYTHLTCCYWLLVNTTATNRKSSWPTKTRSECNLYVIRRLLSRETKWQ